MGPRSNFHAKIGRRGAAMYRNLFLALSLMTFLVLLAGTPARAAATAPYAGQVLGTAASASERTFTLRAPRFFRAAATTVAAPRTHARGRLVLSPRRLTEARSPARIQFADARDLRDDPSMLVEVDWSEASQPNSEANPFTMVGNRDGLVNANHTEVRDGEVWLSAGGGRDAPVDTDAGTAHGMTP